jgi:hypothetical protein
MQNTHSESQGVDWTSVATEFYDTTKSVRSIARAAGISETAIRKHAKRHGWRRPSAAAHVETRGVSHLGGALEAQALFAEFGAEIEFHAGRRLNVAG